MKHCSTQEAIERLLHENKILSITLYVIAVLAVVCGIVILGFRPRWSACSTSRQNQSLQLLIRRQRSRSRLEPLEQRIRKQECRMSELLTLRPIDSKGSPTNVCQKC